ncbi:MAG: ATP-binding protein [Actinomycetota bacterium]
MSGDVVVLVVAADASQRELLASDLRNILPPAARVEAVAEVGAASEVGAAVRAGGGIVPVAFVSLDQRSDRRVDNIMALHDDPAFGTTRLVVITSRASLHGVDVALQRGAVHGMITRPWTEHGLREMVEAHLATCLTEHAPDRLGEFVDFLDDEDRAAAIARIEQRAAASSGDGDDVLHPLLDDRDEEAIEAQMVRLLDRALGHPPRIRIGPGTVLIEAGEDVGGIYVVLEGSVRLTSRTEQGERILHEGSTGPIVGLLSLATHRRAMLECRAVTDVRAIPVTIDQLDRALDAEPGLAGLLTRVLIRSLAQRLRRSDELQVELDESLAALSAAKAQLVASARFATLGELSAGMAHELNNPTAALTRSVDHLTEDLFAVVDAPELAAAIRDGAEEPVRSTADRRAHRRALTEVLGDRRLAERLVELGVTEPAEAQRVAALGDEQLARLESARRLGRTLRDANSAAGRIQSLVESLRAYARGEDGRGPTVPDVVVAEGLDHALRLLSHRLTDVVVDWDIDPDVPPIAARPGALQQVWTNLLANALDAMGDRGLLGLRVTGTDGGGVRVSVVDGGPGVPPDLLPRIFEPRFTTKDGRVRFGMGLGLSISRQIVEEHGGTIEVSSRPGHTVFTVELPGGGA